MVPVIVIPVLNRYDLLERCLASIDHPVETLIVIDNGGQAGLHDQPWLVDRRHVQDYRIWSMPSNLGVATSWNLGIKATPFSSGWLLLNSDAWFKPGQLERFYRDCAPGRVTLGGAPGWCSAHIGRDVVAKIGLFCENFHPAYFEDTDFQRRAMAHGFPILHSEAEIGHDNSSTIGSDPKLADYNSKSFAANVLLYDRRWLNGIPAHEEWDLDRRVELGWER